ncbi:MAG TPA: xanthine dehydrogenase family protein subunit M [Ramlibacter sp.]|nr:xanthine dehydrogenase family protein subunit M [Ramlibacter sp.]
MYEVDYRRPTSIEAAAHLLASTGGRPLAGGQTLVSAMKLRLAQPGTLVDLGAIPELRGIRREGDTIVIGASMRHAEVAASEEVNRAIPALARLAGGIGDRQVRNMGTMGGSVANYDPAACYPCGVLGLGGMVRTNRRAMPAEAFFRGMYETALEEGELITAIAFPIPRRAGYIKFKQEASRFALVGVFVADTHGGVRVAVTGAGAGIFRATAIERALSASFTPEAAKAVKVSPEGLSSDLHADAEYRAHLVSVMAGRAVAQALEVAP